MYDYMVRHISQALLFAPETHDDIPNRTSDDLRHFCCLAQVLVIDLNVLEQERGQNISVCSTCEAENTELDVTEENPNCVDEFERERRNDHEQW